MSMSFAKASRLASVSPKEFNFEYFVFQNEADYPSWINMKDTLECLRELQASLAWNAIICATAFISLVIVSMDYVSEDAILVVLPLSEAADILYNVLYFFHVAAHLIKDLYQYHYEKSRFGNITPLWYLADFCSYVHYFTPLLAASTDSLDMPYIVKVTCYYVRLHRPFRFLWALNDHHLKGSVIYTLIKHWYIFLVIRLLSANFCLWTGMIVKPKYEDPPEWMKKTRTQNFLRAFFVMDKFFLPLGPDSQSETDVERMASLIVMVSGALLVMGITIASLTLIVGLYLRSEEIFRARFRLIMQEMRETRVPQPLIEKVETFYRMYWHKQRAVSVTKLLPTYPPTLYNTIYIDIYFEAQQRSVILRDLSYQFLCEIAKYMKTTNYIPGEAIIRRNTNKSAIVYISYGDVEMLTADDDQTPMLRFTRGSIMNPCGGCVEVAGTRAHVSIRAGTFCTAHVLEAVDLWRVVAKYGRMNEQTFILRSCFMDHLEKVKSHYDSRPHPPVKYKSTILLLKRNLMELKKAKDENGRLFLGRTDVFLEIAGCYIMRNRTNACLEVESDAICLRSTYPCILQPMSSLQVAWQCFVGALTLTVAFTHPYQLVYINTISPSFRYFDYMVTFFYILDIIVHLSTGDKIEEGVPTTFTQTSSQQMKSSWFILDVIAAAPMFEFIGSGRFTGLNKLFKLPKLFRVLKQLEEVLVYQDKELRFISYMLLMVLMVWLVAALQQGHCCFMMDHCLVRNFTDCPFWSKEPLDDGPVQNRLLYSFYWSISLSFFADHKTADVSKTIFQDQLFTMILLEACVIIHIMVQATYSAYIMVTEIMRENYNNCILRVMNFFVMNNIDPQLRHRFITYLQLCYYTDKAYRITNAKKSILFDLPHHVYQDISVMQRNKYILSVPFMKHLPENELKSICAQALLFYTSPNEILVNTGDFVNEIYIIRQGICEILDPDTQTPISMMDSKSCFGDIECLLRIPAYYTVRAVTHVEVFSISRKHLFAAIAMPKIKDAILYAKQLPEYTKLLRQRREQFLTYERPPPPPSREWFPLPSKHEPDIAFLTPFSGLGVFSNLKYVFPRFTIRPDGPYLRRYEWFRAFCAFLAANIYPFYSFLELQFPWLWYFCWFLDLTAYFDILQRMLIAYFDKQGILVYHPASTAAQYIRGAFLVDLLACVPLEALDSVRQTIYFEENSYQHMTMPQILMYNRLLQLYRVPNALELLNDYMDRQDIILIIKSIPMFLALLNVVTSLGMECSVMKWARVGGGWRLTVLRDPDQGSWLEKYSNAVRYNMTETPLSLTLTMYYWVVYEITTTGLNLFQPNNLDLMITLTVGMLIGGLMTTYYSVRVISIRSNVNWALASYQEHMKDMITYMKRENLSKDLQCEVVSYYEYMWVRTAGTDNRSVLKLCDQITLRTDAILHIYGHTFAKCPILSQCDLAVLRLIGRAVHSVYFRQNTTVLEKDEVISELYFVDYGTIEAWDLVGSDTFVTKLPRGSIFGNLEPEARVLNQNKFMTAKNTHLLQIKASLFYGIIQDFPSVLMLMKKYRPNKENYVIGSLSEESVASPKFKKDKKNRSPAVVRRLQKLYEHLHSRSKGVQIYLIIVCMLCVYGDLYNAGFQDNRITLIAILYALDAAFILKIVLNYTLPYVTDEESESKTVFVLSREKYFEVEFKYDVLSCLPLELFCLLFSNVWTAFAFLRLNRVFRIVTIDICLKRYHQKLSINLTVSTIWSVFIWFTLFIHTVTCIWYQLGALEEQSEQYSSWRYNDDGKSVCHNHYVCAFYFILTIFTQNGIGDILPKQHTEVLFVTILMIISRLMYMIYVGQFSNIIQYQFFRCFDFYSDYLELQDFLKNNRVAANLVNMTNKYTVHLWRAARGLQVPHFLTNAPQCLRLKVMSAAYMHHLQRHPVFKDCEPMFLRHLAGAFQPFFYKEGMFVVREGEITNAMYFVHKGYVKEMADEPGKKLHTIHADEHFGTNEGLRKNSPYGYSYETVVKSQVLTLALDRWEHLLKHYPKSEDIILSHHPQTNYNRRLGVELLDKRQQTPEEKTGPGKSKTVKLPPQKNVVPLVSPPKPGVPPSAPAAGLISLPDEKRPPTKGLPSTDGQLKHDIGEIRRKLLLNEPSETEGLIFYNPSETRSADSATKRDLVNDLNKLSDVTTSGELNKTGKRTIAFTDDILGISESKGTPKIKSTPSVVEPMSLIIPETDEQIQNRPAQRRANQLSITPEPRGSASHTFKSKEKPNPLRKQKHKVTAFIDEEAKKIFNLPPTGLSPDLKHNQKNEDSRPTDSRIFLSDTVHAKPKSSQDTLTPHETDYPKDGLKDIKIREKQDAKIKEEPLKIISPTESLLTIKAESNDSIKGDFLKHQASYKQKNKSLASSKTNISSKEKTREASIDKEATITSLFKKNEVDEQQRALDSSVASRPSSSKEMTHKEQPTNETGSVLSFRDQITTFKVPKRDKESVPSSGGIKIDEDKIRSTASFKDDVEMKEPKKSMSENMSGAKNDKLDEGSIMQQKRRRDMEIPSTSQEAKKSVSIAKSVTAVGSKSPKIVKSVEEHMMKKKRDKYEGKKKPTDDLQNNLGVEEHVLEKRRSDVEIPSTSQEAKKSVSITESVTAVGSRSPKSVKSVEEYIMEKKRDKYEGKKKPADDLQTNLHVEEHVIKKRRSDVEIPNTSQEAKKTVSIAESVTIVGSKSPKSVKSVEEFIIDKKRDKHEGKKKLADSSQTNLGVEEHVLEKRRSDVEIPSTSQEAKKSIPIAESVNAVGSKSPKSVKSVEEFIIEKKRDKHVEKKKPTDDSQDNLGVEERVLKKRRSDVEIPSTSQETKKTIPIAESVTIVGSKSPKSVKSVEEFIIEKKRDKQEGKKKPADSSHTNLGVEEHVLEKRRSDVEISSTSQEAKKLTSIAESVNAVGSKSPKSVKSVEEYMIEKKRDKHVEKNNPTDDSQNNLGVEERVLEKRRSDVEIPSTSQEAKKSIPIAESVTIVGSKRPKSVKSVEEYMTHKEQPKNKTVSVLSYRDQITTFKVPERDKESVPSSGGIKIDEDKIRSTASLKDDVEMKEPKKSMSGAKHYKLDVDSLPKKDEKKEYKLRTNRHLDIVSTISLPRLESKKCVDDILMDKMERHVLEKRRNDVEIPSTSQEAKKSISIAESDTAVGSKSPESVKSVEEYMMEKKRNKHEEKKKPADDSQTNLGVEKHALEKIRAKRDKKEHKRKEATKRESVSSGSSFQSDPDYPPASEKDKESSEPKPGSNRGNPPSSK